MMSKIRKAQDSWLAKSILFLTALSFMSLFGISGYVGSAGKNKPVIEVDNFEVLQSTILAEVDNQVSMARGMLGDNLNDSIRAGIMQQIISRNLSDLIIMRTADKLNMSISDALIRQEIFSKGEFTDEATGRFDLNKMRRTLYMYGMNEADYIKQVKLDIKKDHLINYPAEYINVPEVMAEYEAKIQNQKKMFKYIKLETAKTKIDRKISNEEVEQYYQDFIADFTNPEVRDVDFIIINNGDIASKIIPTDDEVNSYYKEHISQFETPEQRRVLQMVLGSEEEASDAMSALNDGKDFFQTAKEIANQDREDTDFGLVDKDMLVEEISAAAFSALKDKVIGPVKSDLGWHILKITEIKPATKVSSAKAKADITEEIRKERSYEALQDTIRNIDDKVVTGTTLKDLAKEFNARVYSVAGLNEQGSFKRQPRAYGEIVKSEEFIDMAFSYNEGEISQVIETNDGLVLLSVGKIIGAHPKEIGEVRVEIEKIWAENERNAIVQEITNDVVNDLEAGDSMEDISSRFSLHMKTTAPLKRDESFEDLNKNVMLQLFQEAYGYPKVIDQGNTKLVIISVKTKNGKNNISKEDVQVSKAMLKLNMTREYAQYLLDSFARDYKITINYKQLGLE